MTGDYVRDAVGIYIWLATAAVAGVLIAIVGVGSLMALARHVWRRHRAPHV